MTKDMLQALILSLAEDENREIETLSIVAINSKEWAVSLIIQ